MGFLARHGLMLLELLLLDLLPLAGPGLRCLLLMGDLARDTLILLDLFRTNFLPELTRDPLKYGLTLLDLLLVNLLPLLTLRSYTCRFCAGLLDLLLSEPPLD
jgi:hypothetical protein